MGLFQWIGQSPRLINDIMIVPRTVHVQSQICFQCSKQYKTSILENLWDWELSHGGADTVAASTSENIKIIKSKSLVLKVKS